MRRNGGGRRRNAPIGAITRVDLFGDACHILPTVEHSVTTGSRRSYSGIVGCDWCDPFSRSKKKKVDWPLSLLF